MEMNKAQTLNVYHVLHDPYEIYVQRAQQVSGLSVKA